MNDLERRALLGDKQAQRECTEKGIVLHCPCCGEKMEKEGRTFFHKNIRCILNLVSFYETDAYLIALWNTRPAPPIGRCKDCKYYPYARVETGGFVYCPQSEMQIEDENTFCSSFEPREG